MKLACFRNQRMQLLRPGSSASKCSFLAGLFPSATDASKSSYKFSSVASRFKQQLQALMESLKETEPHYIRCVKPNSSNKPQKFENSNVLQQLRCGGVLEAVRISLAGYPTRRTYSEFVHRFGILALECMDGSYDEKALAKRILEKLKLDNFQLGISKIFLRAGQTAVLDSRRTEVLDTSARLIQGRLQTFLARRYFISTREAAIILQAYCSQIDFLHLCAFEISMLLFQNQIVRNFKTHGDTHLQMLYNHNSMSNKSISFANFYTMLVC